MTPEDMESPPPAWSRARRDLAAVLWPSFLIACVATMLLFALIDPADFGEHLPHSLWSARTAAYSAGFFFLWLVCIASAALTLYMVRTDREERGRTAR
jgi:hypothetical protein